MMNKEDMIIDMLKEKLITHRELADIVGISEVSLNRYLSGKRNMPEDLFERVIKAIEEVKQ